MATSSIRMATYDGTIKSYDQQIEERVEELEHVFDPPYQTMKALVLAGEGHELGKCVQCDAYRRMAEKEADGDD